MPGPLKQRLTAWGWKVRGYLRRYRTDAWLLEGRERSGKSGISVLLFGNSITRTYLARLVYGGNCTETHIGRTWTWNISRLTRKISPDLAVVSADDRQRYRHLRSEKTFFIPEWVHGEIVFGDARARMKTSGHLKSDLRRVRKNNLGFEITRDPARFDDFYSTMYQPYISNAYGPLALLMSYEKMKSQENNSELMLVTRDGEVLAGQILVYENNRVRCWSIGVKNGDHANVKTGAHAALYLHEIEYLEDKGYESMNVGSSRAFLNDGVLQFKNKWGMRITGASGKGFLLQVLRKSAGSISFLVNNPFIQADRDGYTGVVFLEHGTKRTQDLFRELYAKYRLSGLQGLKVYVDGSGNELQPPVGDIILASVDSLF